MTNPQVVSSTKETLKVTVDFWHTLVGITLKRLFISTGVIVILALADALVQEKINWVGVFYGVRVQLGYMLYSTFSVYRDPSIPNTTKDTMTVNK